MVIERGGQKIGVVGLTIAGKTRASSSPDPDTTFEDEATAAQREIDALTAQGVDKIVLLSHIGYDYDKQVIAKLRGVDVVVGGDSHTLLGPGLLSNLGVGSPAGAYPTQLTDAGGSPVCLVQAWEYAQVVGELTVEFDGQGKVTACGGTPHVLIGDDFKLAAGAPTEAQRQAIARQIAQSGVLRVTAPNARAAQVLQPYADALEAFTLQQVAVVEEEICSRRVPGGEGSVDYSRSSTSCNELGHVNVHGGDVQQLAAQAYLEVTRLSYGGADISLQSGGGARVPLTVGPLTAAQAIAVLPFGNKLYRLTLTAGEVRAMLEDGLDAVYGPGGTTGPYPYTGGLRFAVDARAAKGSRVSQAEWHNPATDAWEPLSDARTYQLAVLSFNADGGDGYATLAQVPAERRLDVGVLDSDVFFEYIAAQPVGEGGLPALRRLPTALYSTQQYTAP
jgi:5'-nucleotidase